MNAPEKKLDSAKSYLIFHQPFFAVPLLRLRLAATSQMPTAATDGRAIYYNPEFIDSLSLEETIFILAHEVLHVVLAHHLRRGTRNHKAWNAAADYVINLILEKAGFTIADNVLHDPRFEGWSTEQVYRLLVQTAEQTLADQKQQAGSGQATLEDLIPEGAGGQVLDMKSEDGSELSQAERTRVEDELTVTLEQARRADAMFRSDEQLRTAIARAVAQSRSPGFDARAELWDFVTATLGARDDYSWTRPNPRFLPMSLYLPSLAATFALRDVVVAIDTSGSISPHVLSFMAGAVDDLLAAYPETLLHVVYCDKVVQATEEITVSDCPVSFRNAKGGGGTRFSPVFEWVKERGLNPAVLLYLTDLLGDAPEEPGYPVLWLVVGRYRGQTMPFGRRIDLTHFEEELNSH
jgi:predicted metal-dependent peptidase